MKVQITTSNQEHIAGYREISIKDGKIDFQEISDNECIYILANNILDVFPADHLKQCIAELVKKLRLGGTLVVGGTDLRVFSLNVIIIASKVFLFGTILIEKMVRMARI